MRKFTVLLLAALLAAPLSALAATTDELQKEIQKLTQELEDISKRVDKNEKKSALDRISFSGDMRVKGDTLHYKDVTFNPGINVDFQDFFEKLAPPAMMGVSGPLGNFTAFNPMAPDFQDVDGIPGPDGIADFADQSLNPSALDNMFSNLYNTNPVLYNQLLNNFGMWGMGGMTGAGVGPFPLAKKTTSDINNDILYTTRLRLNMKADVYKNVKFAGRLSMYKNWGDSTGNKVFDSWNSFTMDGTDGGNTTGDWVRVERAYFDWSDIGGSDFYLSIGRRPSTYGPPSQFRENELRGGTPSGHLVHFNFDGITIGYKLAALTGIEGQTVRFCYGQGFESEYGNGELFNELDTKDTHLGGFNIDAFNDGTHFLQFTLFRAQDVNDGFKGIIAFPTQYASIFAPTLYNDIQKFSNFNFVTRVQPSTVIGDINLGGAGYTYEGMNGVNFFVSGGWTQMRPTGNAGMFGGMGSDAVFEAQLNSSGTEIIMAPVRAQSDENQDGHSIYAGIQVPAPMGKLGLEYNYGSRYWMPFTQGQDDVVGSKLATRGQVGEAYYIFDVNPNMFIKVGGLYYDYKYTNSGTPVGKPQKIDDVEDGLAFSMLPAVDKVWDGYASLTVKF